MIIYGLFTALAMLGFVFFVVGVYLEMDIFALIGPALGSPGFLPMSLGFFMMSFMIMFICIIGIFVRIRMTGIGMRFDKNPVGKSIFNFIFRDGYSKDVYGTRRPGIGIFDLPQHGVVVDVGRNPSPGSVYRFGGKPIRFALQDISYTPNPKFSNIYSFLSTLGFNNMNDVQDVFNGYNPELMAKIWNKLVEYVPVPPEQKIIDNIREMDKTEVEQNNKMWKDEKKDISHSEIDELLRGRGL